MKGDHILFHRNTTISNKAKTSEVTHLQFAKIVLLAEMFHKPENWISWYNRKLRNALCWSFLNTLKTFRNYPNNFPWANMVNQKCDALNKLLNG